MINDQAARMLKDMDRLQLTSKTSVDKKGEAKEGVDLWRDADFYFSVVFQSAEQKYDFLEQFSKKYNLGIDNVKNEDEVYSIVNGIVLSEKLGFKIRLEKKVDYVYPDLELKQLVLDGDEF